MRLFAASLTLFALVRLIACEAFALAGFLKLVLGNETVARVLTVGALLLAVLCAVPRANSEPCMPANCSSA